MTAALAADDLLRRPVRLRDIEVGRPTDLVLDGDGGRALGLEVLCGDEVRRFLPLSAARVAAGVIEIRSALLLLDEGGLAFYRARGRSLRELRGLEVRRRGRPLGALADVVLAPGWDVVDLVVETPAGVRRVAFDGTVRVGERGRRSAA